MKKIVYSFVLAAIILMVGNVAAQKVLYLHHSTGGNLFNNGYVAQSIDTFNQHHSTNVEITERAYPDSPYPWSNYPYDYWNLWVAKNCDSNNPNIECLNTMVQNYDVIVFKHCFPGAQIEPDQGNPDVTSETKSIENYKLQYRALLAMIDSFSNTKFIVWTLVPLHRLATDAAQAQRAAAFVDWVKNTWLKEDGKAHPNIFIFDFFGYVAEQQPNPVNGFQYCLKYEYEGAHDNSDSHPNDLANTTVGPIMAQFIVDVALGLTTKVESNNHLNHSTIFSNSSYGNLSIDLNDFSKGNANISIFNIQGMTLYKNIKYVNQGNNRINLSLPALANGVYLLNINDNRNNQTFKLNIFK